MGSSGSGSFSDYSGRPTKPSGNGGSSGGNSGEDRCRQAFNTELEDVAQYDFHSQNNDVPPPGTNLTIALRGRLVAVDSDGTSVGALPTRLNYLAGCLQDGVQYAGVVRSSANAAVPRVEVDFVAI
ncbi:hypothetical protein [Rhizobium sp. PAMB 3182]